MRRLRVAAFALAVPALVAGAAACDSKPKVHETRMYTEDLSIRVSTEPVPPRAREDIVFKVIVNDRKSGQPIEKGEGRIFAMNEDSVQKWDGLEPGPETGTYYAKLNFVTSGQWAIGMQFRRDSTQKLQRLDWQQQVFPERAGN